MTEAQHQKTVVDWSLCIRQTYPELRLLYHIPNGGRRDLIEARHLKETGVKPGVPDLCLPVARGTYHGLYVEMKDETGKERPEQVWWREELTAQGYRSVVCHGWESAIGVLKWYLKLGTFHL